MRCYAYTEGGNICGAEATVLDLRRGFYVCPEHDPRNVARDCAAVQHSFKPGEPIPAAEFQKLIAEAHDEMQVRRIVLYYQEHMVGTPKEITQAMDFASERAMHFDGPAEGRKPAEPVVTN